MTKHLRWGVVLVLLAAASGCKDEPPKSDRPTEAPDAGPNSALADKNIEAAVNAAAGDASAAPTNGQAGPPPSGVFGPGEAEKAHGQSAPLQLEVIDRGSEPRVALAPAFTSGKQSVTVTVGKSYARQMFPTIDYTLSVAVEGLPEATGEAGAAPAPAPSGPLTMVATITNVAAAGAQGAAVPPEVSKQLAALKGGQLRAKLAADGSISQESLKLPKDAPKGFSDIAGALPEVVSLIMTPWPKEKVGLGAYWISTDRTVSSSVPVVRYRVTKIEQLNGDELALSVDLRQYAVDATSRPLGVPEGLTLAAFSSQGKAMVTRKLGKLMPITAELKMPMQLQLVDPNKRAMPLQAETTGQLKPAAAKAPK